MASIKGIFGALAAISGNEWMLLSNESGSTGLEACFGFEFNTAAVDGVCFMLRAENAPEPTATLFLAMDGAGNFEYHDMKTGECGGRMLAIKTICAIGVDAGQATAALGVLEGLMRLPED